MSARRRARRECSNCTSEVSESGLCHVCGAYDAFGENPGSDEDETADDEDE